MTNGDKWDAAPDPRIYADVDAVVGGYLRDLAFAQSLQEKRFGYKRAAAAIFALDRRSPDWSVLMARCPGFPALGLGLGGTAFASAKE